MPPTPEKFLDSPRCVRCHGPFHPATGDHDRRTGANTCGACYQPFVKFVKGQMSRRFAVRAPDGKAREYLRFYDYAESAIVAD